MIEGITLQLALRIMAALFVLWFTSVHIREQKIFWPYVPLFFYFIALAATASAELYEIYITGLQSVFDAIFLIFYTWLLFVIIRLIKKQP